MIISKIAILLYVVSTSMAQPVPVDYAKEGEPDYSSYYQSPDGNPWPADLELKTDSSFRLQLKTKITKKLLAESLLTTDPLGRRLTPGAPKTSLSDVAVMGCSLIFGDGVNDGDTLPAQFQKLTGKYRVLNLSKPGVEAGYFLDRASRKEYAPLSDLKNDTRFLLFFKDDHIRRSLGTISWMRENAQAFNRPAFLLDSDGTTVTAAGVFAERFGLRSWFLKFAAKSDFVHARNWEWPALDEKAVQFQSALINSLQKQLKQKFSDSSFVVIIEPDSTRFGPSLAKLLATSGITTIDLSSIKTDTIHLGSTHSSYGSPEPTYLRDLAKYLTEKYNVLK